LELFNCQTTEKEEFAGIAQNSGKYGKSKGNSRSPASPTFPLKRKKNYQIFYKNREKT